MTTAITGVERTNFGGQVVRLRTRADRLESKANGLYADADTMSAIGRAMHAADDPKVRKGAEPVGNMAYTLAKSATVKEEQAETLRSASDFAEAQGENIPLFPGSGRVWGRVARLLERVPKDERAGYRADARTVMLSAKDATKAKENVDALFSKYIVAG